MVSCEGSGVSRRLAGAVVTLSPPDAAAVGLRPGAKAAGRATDPLPATRLPSTLHEWCRYPSRRRPPAGPEPPPGQLGSLGAGGATHTQLGLKATASPDVEPDAQPATQGQRRVGRRVDILADVDRANPFTPPPGGPFSVWR